MKVKMKTTNLSGFVFTAAAVFSLLCTPVCVRAMGKYFQKETTEDSDSQLKKTESGKMEHPEKISKTAEKTMQEVETSAKEAMTPSKTSAMEMKESMEESTQGTIEKTMKTAEGITAGAAAVRALNINSASLDQLAQLAPIDQNLASSIINFREQNGPFQKVESLLQVAGIDTSKYQAIKQLFDAGALTLE